MFIVNERTLLGGLTGAQRYLLELNKRLDLGFRRVSPKVNGKGMLGHFWEQTVLPFSVGKKDILWSPSNTGPIFCRNQVLTLHDIAPIDHPEWFGKQFSTWFNFVVPPLVRNVHKIITVSSFSRARIADACGVESEKIEVIYNGVDNRFGMCSDEDVFDVGARYGCKYKRYLLTVGSIEPRKNLARLLKAWSLVQSKLDDDMLLVVVGGIGNTKIFNEVDLPDDIPNVKFVGRVPDDVLPALYQGARGFAYLSVYEGFGLPVLEAMASGIPVLTSDKTVLMEIMGDAGIAVDPYSLDAIGEGLRTLCDDTASVSAFENAGKVRAQDFSWDIAAKKTADVLVQSQQELS